MSGNKIKTKYYAWIGQDDDGKLSIEKVSAYIARNPERARRWLEKRKLTDHNAVLVADNEVETVVMVLRAQNWPAAHLRGKEGAR